MWKPGEDFAVRLKDKTGDARADKDLDAMTKRIDAVAQEYGFSISVWGSWKGLRRIAIGETVIFARRTIEGIAKDNEFF